MKKSIDRVIGDIYFEATGNLSALVHSIENFISNGAKSLLIMSCDNDLQPQDIDSYLQSIPVPVFGGIFPKIVYQEKIHDRGFLIVSLKVTANTTVLKENCTSHDIASSLNNTDQKNN